MFHMGHPLHWYCFLAIFFLGLNHLFSWTLEILKDNCTIDEIMLWNSCVSVFLAMDCLKVVVVSCSKTLEWTFWSLSHYLVICKWLTNAHYPTFAWNSTSKLFSFFFFGIDGYKSKFSCFLQECRGYGYVDMMQMKKKFNFF